METAKLLIWKYFPLLLFSISWSDIRPREILVLVNTLSPQSRLIGKTYQELRGVPQTNILELEIPERETISRELYNEKIREPVREYLKEAENFQILYMVTTKGLPRRIAHQEGLNSMSATAQFNFNGAALESELMNVLFDYTSFSGWKNRTPRLSSLEKRREMIVTRLDGPEVQQIETTLKVALAHEKLGAKGSVCFEIEDNIVENPRFIPLLQSMDKLRRYYTDYTSDLKFYFRDKVALPGFSGMDSNLIVVNLFEEQTSKCELASGGVGLSMSGNQKSAKGVSRAFGTGFYFDVVGPVYASGFPKPHEFVALLLSGKYPLGEILNQILPHSSWQLVFVGDPMYNPFASNPQFEPDKLEIIMGHSQ